MIDALVTIIMTVQIGSAEVINTQHTTIFIEDPAACTEIVSDWVDNAVNATQKQLEIATKQKVSIEYVYSDNCQ